MAGQANDQDDMITGINVTPMVDVMLVLLVIFMIAAPTLYQGSLKIELPSARNGEKTEKVTLRFSLLKDGKIVLDKKPITKDEVAGYINKAVELDPKADAVVAADRALSHGTVIEFIDYLKAQGIQRFAVAVEGPEAKH
jgi:biopolymer transport protein ExbD